jgi:hypothetical protein
MHQIDPELIFLKWAYKAEFLDADQLHDLHVRASEERPDDLLLDLILEWEYLTRDQMAHLLSSAAIERGVAEGRLPAEQVIHLEALDLPEDDGS